MVDLINKIRRTFPLDAPDSRVCRFDCTVCNKKLLEFLEMQVEDWEQRLAAGETPTLGDLEKFARMARKIHRALKKNGVV
ncbi:MAG: hypothetical protein D6694_13205 [Gammaproteobacteria bacterium]|nr:MAG: hypothetical protein D6694_13205 [Gammaproteobacteria bacterium]